MSDFGAGPFLSRDLDFEVTTTGDIETVQGLDELEKDIALQTLIELQDLVGRPQTEQASAEIKAQIRRLLNRDPRVDQLISIQVTFNAPEDAAEVVAEVRADNTEQELVFTI